MKVKLKDKTFTYRFATEKDVDIINRFDKRIFTEATTRFYFRHPKKMLIRMMQNGGRIIVVFFKERLVAWAALTTRITDKSGKPNKIKRKDYNKYGFIMAAAVSKRYRGNGIQKFLIKKRIEYLKKHNKKYVLNCVNPKNQYSVANTFASGFKYNAVEYNKKLKKYINHYILKL